ncbi:MAG: type II toxin-antitoxin system RelE/ParE family toxin [Candidatus Ruthia sp.]|nr:type II toxin-antitoxin system RelE/ParE family toxin [Candidatus Ruthturnera sp.]
MLNVQNSASLKIDEIYRYTIKTWGKKQAKIYINGLFESFNNIGSNLVVSYPMPADFGIDGFYLRYEKHYIYWKYLDNGDIGIVTVLHERMHQIKQFNQER